MINKKKESDGKKDKSKKLLIQYLILKFIKIQLYIKNRFNKKY